MKKIARATLTLGIVGVAAMPLPSSALTIAEALALFTPGNIAAYFPGYTPVQYSNAAAAINTAFTTQSSCIQHFNEGLVLDTAAEIACSAYLTPILDGITGLTGGDYSPLKIILTSYVTQVITPIVSQQIQQATSMRQADAISSVLNSAGNSRRGGPSRVSLDSGSGMAAGNVATKWNGWISATGNRVKNDFKNSAYDGDVDSFIGGVDYTFDQNWVAGLSLASERTDIATPYNGGSLKARSWTLAPYLSYRISNSLSLDASAGYAWGDQDINWSLGTSSRSTNQGLERNFFAVNLNTDRWIGDWQLSGKAGVIRAEEQLDANTSLLSDKVKSRLTQLKFNGRAGYWINDVMPYAALSYTRDVQQSSNFDKLPGELKDKDGWTATLGVDFFSRNGITGGVFYASEKGRSHLTNNVLMGSLSIRF